MRAWTGRTGRATPSRRALLSLLVFAFAPASPATDDAYARERVREESLATQPDYQSIIAMYRGGRYAAALNSLQGVDLEDIVSRLDAPDASEQRQSEPASAGATEHGTDLPALRLEDDELRAAALMHSDLGMRHGAKLQFTAAVAQLEMAENLIDRIRNAAAREAFRRDQLLALGYYFQANAFKHGVLRGFELAEESYDEAVRRFPRNAEICLSAGTLHEWSGSLKYGDREKLKKARELYQKALRANPRLAEAYLRYGRVLVKLGDDDGAAPYFLAALERNDEATPLMSYVAYVMLGGIAERGGDLESAIESYEKASQLIPGWETARMALSHALHVSGRYEESTQVLTAMLDAEIASSEAFDGWAVYELGRTERLEALWARMRDGISP